MSDKQHPIQVVVRRTGLTADVLRAWERRYGVVEPGRSPTGRRLYSDADIERLRLLRRAKLAGRSIGQISGLPTDELVRQLREDEAEEARAPEPAAERGDPAHQLQLDALAAVDAMDAAGLEQVLRRAGTVLGAERALEAVIAPTLTVVGERWHAGGLSVAHEHAASAVVRQVAGDLLRAASDDPDRPLALFATPAGERHELGALMAAVIAATHGWRVLYLGADVPTGDIARAAQRHRAGVVAVSVVSREQASHVSSELRSLRAALPSDTTLIVGGRGLPEQEALLDEIGAVGIDTLATLREYFVAGIPAPDRR